MKPVSFSTMASSAIDPRTQWVRMVRSHIDSLEVEVGEERDFSGTFSTTSLGGNRICLVTADAQAITRVPSRGDRLAPLFHLIYVRDGHFDLDSEVRRGRVGAGDWVFLSNEKAFRFETSRNCSCVALHLSGQWLQNYLPIPAQALEEQLIGSAPEPTPWHLSLRYCLQAIADTPIDTLGREGIFALEQVPRLLSLACDLTKVDASRHQSMIMRSIMMAIRARYPTPGLDATMVGAEVGVSRRYLYAILASHGTTFARELQKIRLEKAAEILASPRFSGARISDVAFAIGLLDPVHFAKSFKARFGLTPSQHRDRERLLLNETRPENYRSS